MICTDCTREKQACSGAVPQAPHDVPLETASNVLQIKTSVRVSRVAQRILSSAEKRNYPQKFLKFTYTYSSKVLPQNTQRRSSSRAPQKFLKSSSSQVLQECLKRGLKSPSRGRQTRLIRNHSPARSMINRSMPIPSPAVGGMPRSKASKKSSSTSHASSSPAAWDVEK